MEDTIVLYSSPEHLNSMSVLAKFMSKHHPSVPIIILSTAAESAATSVTAIPSITYCRLPNPTLPPNMTTDMATLLFVVPRLNNTNLCKCLEEISEKARIRAFVMDFFCNAAFEVCMSLNIASYFYVSVGALGVCTLLHFPTIDDTIAGDIRDLNDFLEIPGCPPLHSSDIPTGLQFRQGNSYKHFISTGINMGRAAGILVNSFDALEIRAKEALEKGLCIPNAPTPPVYFVGPLVAEADTKNSGEEHECLRWLDKQPSRSVVFLCFGRRGLFSGEQLKAMAVGLENSGHRFLWSVRSPPEKKDATAAVLDELFPEGFLERTRDRGFVVKSWAPQTAVLSHGAVAGFVTHCGRSSILEAVSYGVPMITWPLYAEQRINSVFMVKEMGLALPLEEAAGGFVTAAELEKRVKELMESKAGEGVRERVSEMKKAAMAAMREKGSSLLALQNFFKAVFN